MSNPEVKALGSLAFFEIIEERNQAAARARLIRKTMKKAGAQEIKDIIRSAPPHPLTIPDRIWVILNSLHEPGEPRGAVCGFECDLEKRREAAMSWARKHGSTASFAKHISKTLGFPLRKYKLND